MPAGDREYETWVTWQTDKASDPDFERFDIRHEFEFGVTDRFQLAFYLPDWRYEESATESGKAEFRDIAVEAIYGLSDPNTDLLGSAVYGEVKVGDDFIELEAKLLLQKNVGRWMFVYNLGAEVEWEHSYDDDEAELMQSIGISYQPNPAWSFGIEAVHECEVSDVERFGDNVVYAGPNVVWRRGGWWVALTGMWQITDVDGKPDFQLRTIVAVDF